jgi:cardiolipin synthase
MITTYLPNLISLTRLGLAVVMYYSIVQEEWLTAMVILCIAILSDLLDGFLARKFNRTSNIGGVLDHGSDAIFVAVSIAALAHHGFAPALLGLLILIAFLQYLLDSKSLSGRPLRASFIGRYNGIAYYVFAGLPIIQINLEIIVIPFDWFVWIGWGLVLTTTISMIDRLETLISKRLKNR